MYYACLCSAVTGTMGPLTCREQNKEIDMYRKIERERERERERACIKKKTWYYIFYIRVISTALLHIHSNGDKIHLDTNYFHEVWASHRMIHQLHFFLLIRNVS